MEKFNKFMNYASQCSVLIVMKDNSVVEIMSDYFRDTVDTFSNLKHFIDNTFPFTNGMRDFSSYYTLNKKATTLYWGHL